jgi:enamine deaminase RidA (YjgF/YER057c/UK114 family)
MTVPAGTTSSAPITREQHPGLWLTAIDRQRIRELHLTLRPLPGEDFPALLRRLDAVLGEHEANVVRHEIFGSNRVAKHALPLMNRQPGGLHWPVTWVEGADCAGGGIAGLHVWAVAGARVEPVNVGGRVVGTVFEDGLGRHCLLGGVRPKDLSASRPHQAKQTFEALETALSTVGMKLANVVRTWFFLDDILGWYDSFNHVRTSFLEARGLFEGLVPASTGIGAANPIGAAVLAGAHAVQTKESRVRVCEVESPKQCSARNYGSSFSRAVELSTPEHRHLLVSGTASIEPGGHSVCVGDAEGQIDLTLQVVRAILVSREMDWPDVTRATAYLRNPADLPVFEKWCTKLGLANWPLVTNQAVICRDELLFELEVDAVAVARAESGDSQVS